MKYPYILGRENCSAPVSAIMHRPPPLGGTAFVLSAICSRGLGRVKGDQRTELIQRGITMPKITTRGRSNASASTTSPPRMSVRAKAIDRREALKDFMTQYELTPADLARRVGLTNPNLFYNFLNGRSFSLSLQTLELIREAFPGSNLSGLLDGRQTRQATCKVVAEARAGVGQPGFMLPANRQVQMVLPPGFLHGSEGIFAVRVEAPGTNALYPTGSILICRPYGSVGGRLPARPRVIVQRQLGAGVEVTVRELVIRAGTAWLWRRSSHPDHQEPIPMPWPPREAVNPATNDGTAIVGIVLASWQPEAAATRP